MGHTLHKFRKWISQIVVFSFLFTIALSAYANPKANDIIPVFYVCNDASAIMEVIDVSRIDRDTVMAAVKKHVENANCMYLEDPVTVKATRLIKRVTDFAGMTVDAWIIESRDPGVTWYALTRYKAEKI